MATLKRFGLFSLLLHKGGAARYWEIDALRGVAITMMVIYHFVYDLAFWGHINYASAVTGGWRVFARATASLFILLVGVSLAISYARARRREEGWALYRKYLARGLKLAGWGLVVTLATWLFVGRVVIFFGILHLIGVVTMLAYPFLSLRRATLPLGVAMIGLGFFLNQLPVSHPWLLWLGLKPATLFQLDYFPLLPWFGVALVGVFSAQDLYPDGARRFRLPDWSQQPGVRQLVWLGNRSLAIYLLHQPVLIGLLYLARFTTGR
ncbi:MAG: DUF1624 domain-containing protein [Anaerolineae bacterium]